MLVLVASEGFSASLVVKGGVCNQPCHHGLSAPLTQKTLNRSVCFCLLRGAGGAGKEEFLFPLGYFS